MNYQPSPNLGPTNYRQLLKSIFLVMAITLPEKSGAVEIKPMQDTLRDFEDLVGRP